MLVINQRDCKFSAVYHGLVNIKDSSSQILCEGSGWNSEGLYERISGVLLEGTESLRWELGLRNGMRKMSGADNSQKV